MSQLLSNGSLTLAICADEFPLQSNRQCEHLLQTQIAAPYQRNRCQTLTILSNLLIVAANFVVIPVHEFAIPAHVMERTENTQQFYTCR
jgi:hypothetical protein